MSCFPAILSAPSSMVSCSPPNPKVWRRYNRAMVGEGEGVETRGVSPIWGIAQPKDAGQSSPGGHFWIEMDLGPGSKPNRGKKRSCIRGFDFLCRRKAVRPLVGRGKITFELRDDGRLPMERILKLIQQRTG